MPLLYDNSEPYDTPNYTYDGSEIGALVGETRVLIADDLKGIVTLEQSDVVGSAVLEGSDAPSRLIQADDTASRTIEQADTSSDTIVL